MPRQSVISKKKKRGPAPTGHGTPVLVRFREDPLAALDKWRKSQEDKPGRPEAVRRLVEQALKR